MVITYGELLDAAKPVTSEGQIQFDEKKLWARRDVIVGNLLKAGPCEVMILGGTHDLTENVREFAVGSVTTPGDDEAIQGTY